jgi:UDP-glucose 4-epimerase
MELKSKKILVTGGAGFIGSHLCERLLEEGAEIIILDDFSTGKISNISRVKKDVELMEGKVEVYENVSKAAKNCDIIVHQAFPYGKSGMGVDELYIEEGIIGTYNVLKAGVKENVQKVVYASSVAVYGIPQYLPMDEAHPIKPFLPYGVTKYAGELYCAAFSLLYGIETVSLRYFYVYGPRYAQFDHSAMVKFLHSTLKKEPLVIYGDGSQIRDYTYISDVVEGTLLALKKDGLKGEVYNICRGEGIRIMELAQKIIEILNINIPIKFAQSFEYRYSDEFCKIPIGLTTQKEGKWIDERNYEGDISKAQRELGYEPKVSIEEGIKLTMAWLEKTYE